MSRPARTDEPRDRLPLRVHSYPRWVRLLVMAMSGLTLALLVAGGIWWGVVVLGALTVLVHVAMLVPTLRVDETGVHRWPRGARWADVVRVEPVSRRGTAAELTLADGRRLTLPSTLPLRPQELRRLAGLPDEQEPGQADPSPGATGPVPG